MKNNNFEDFDIDEDIDVDSKSTINVDNIKNNISDYSSEKLCEIIVCDRYFGCYKELAVICMEELANRRIAGDKYEFETYIENSYNELPVLNLNIPDLGDVLRQVIGRKINK